MIDAVEHSVRCIEFSYKDENDERNKCEWQDVFEHVKE